MKPDRIPTRSVIPAVLTPFTESGEIDWDDYRAHIQDVTSVDGVTTLMINGASSQDNTLTREDKKRLIRDAIDATDGRTPIIGAVRESKIESNLGILAADAEQAGSEAILIMPPVCSENASVDGALARFRTVFEATDLPVAFYQVNPARNGYPIETMVALAEQDQVFAVKEGSGSPETSEKDMRSMRAVDPDIAIWSTHSRWLIGDLAIGADGILSGMGSISADLHVALCRAMWDNNLPEAQSVSEILWRLTQVFYAPGQNAHTRMKYALSKLGRLENDHVRAPQKSLDQSERYRVDQILNELVNA